MLINLSSSILHEDLYIMENLLSFSFYNVIKVHLRFGLPTLHWDNLKKEVAGT